MGVPSQPNGVAADGAGQRFVLDGVGWKTYEMLAHDLGDRPVRLTFDRGRLEFMAPSFRHEVFANVLGRLVETLAEELNLPYKSGRSATFRRQDLERGLEPDGCFYIAHVQAILGKLEIDLAADPPPDLAIEIDISSSSVSRMDIYAALGVPELWRFDGTRFHVYQLQSGTYEPSDTSPTFPALPVTEVAELVQEVAVLDDLSQSRLLRSWVRQRVRPGV